jgi:kinesin family protein 20
MNSISSYTFSKIFNEASTQEEVFETVCKNMVDDLLMGKSGLLFTYGMTNAGKTFTVVGSGTNPGILPQSLTYLYSLLDEINMKVFCNYVEIYNEEVFDLLSNDPKNKNFKKKLQVKLKGEKFVVQDVSATRLQNIEDFNNALNKGIAKKAHAATNLNQNSSRSHTIFKIILKREQIDEEEISLSIVDLAGSERADRTGAGGKELIEACKINNSLMVLGKCMEAMRHNSISINKKIVPFRESKLTMLFQEYFMGEENITMITNINPRKEDFEESVRALNYSCIAKEIKPVRSKLVNTNTGIK